MRRVALLLALSPAAAAPAAAQEVGIGITRIFEGHDLTTFRADLFFPSHNAIDLAGVAEYRYGDGDDGGRARLFGIGADVSLFRGARPGPYVIGGLVGGVGSDDADDFWGSWSVGAGWQFVANSSISLSGEGRWRGMTEGDRRGVEVGVRFGIRLGPFPDPPPSEQIPPVRPAADPAGKPDVRPAPDTKPPGSVSMVPIAAAEVLPPVDAAEPPDDDAAALAARVIDTAEGAMGQPYKWGGTGDNGGFDCSGLIQYAYAQHGITLPRRSADQARAGRAVEKKVDALAPGDILTFARSGTRISHVGLYLGDGRFIHSASKGVQVSLLSAEDPYGRWWWKRWMGARRVVE
jgi:cell wall-associated NlpC family hydrolase